MIFSIEISPAVKQSDIRHLRNEESFGDKFFFRLRRGQLGIRKLESDQFWDFLSRRNLDDGRQWPAALDDMANVLISNEI